MMELLSSANRGCLAVMTKLAPQSRPARRGAGTTHVREATTAVLMKEAVSAPKNTEEAIKAVATKDAAPIPQDDSFQQLLADAEVTRAVERVALMPELLAGFALTPIQLQLGISHHLAFIAAAVLRCCPSPRDMLAEPSFGPPAVSAAQQNLFARLQIAYNQAIATQYGTPTTRQKLFKLTPLLLPSNDTALHAEMVLLAALAVPRRRDGEDIGTEAVDKEGGKDSINTPASDGMQVQRASSQRRAEKSAPGEVQSETCAPSVGEARGEAAALAAATNGSHARTAASAAEARLLRELTADAAKAKALRASLTASSKLRASGRKRSGRGKVGAKASVRSSAARRVALPSHGAQAAALPKHTLAPSGGDDGEGANKAESDDDDEGSDDDDGDDDGDGDGDGAVLASLRVTRVAGRAESIAKQASSADSLADRVRAQLRQMVKERAEDGTLAAEFVEEAFNPDEWVEVAPRAKGRRNNALTAAASAASAKSHPVSKTVSHIHQDESWPTDEGIAEAAEPRRIVSASEGTVEVGDAGGEEGGWPQCAAATSAACVPAPQHTVDVRRHGGWSEKKSGTAQENREKSVRANAPGAASLALSSSSGDGAQSTDSTAQIACGAALGCSDASNTARTTRGSVDELDPLVRSLRAELGAVRAELDALRVSSAQSEASHVRAAETMRAAVDSANEQRDEAHEALQRSQTRLQSMRLRLYIAESRLQTHHEALRRYLEAVSDMDTGRANRYLT